MKTLSADVGRLGWQVGSSAKILKGDHLRTIPPIFGPNWSTSFRGEIFKAFFPQGSMLKLCRPPWLAGGFIRVHYTVFWLNVIYKGVM